MPKFEINKSLDDAGAYRATVDAAKYRHEGDFFVFYADGSHTKKVLTVRASVVTTIDSAIEKK